MGISLCVPCFNVWESKNLSELERAIGLRVGSERVFLVSAGLFVVFFMFQGDRGWETGGIFGGTGGAEKVTGQSGLPQQAEIARLYWQKLKKSESL